MNIETDIKPGLTGNHEFIVNRQHLASEVGSGLVEVFSTAMMIAGMEACAVATVQPHLPEKLTTVGVHVDISHDAATPLGLKVTFTCKLIDVDGRNLTFEVNAFDPFGCIGKGLHKRVIIDKQKFESRAMSKLKA